MAALPERGSTALGTACNECCRPFTTSHYSCTSCPGGYTVCDDCYWEKQEKEEKHRHPLVFMPLEGLGAPKLLFEWNVQQSPLQGRLLLSNVSPVLEGPDSLRERGVVGVFSVLDGDEIGAMERLKAVYGEDHDSRFETLHCGILDVVVRDKITGIVYYNFRMADVSNPAILSKSRSLADGASVPPLTPDEVFSRAVVFTEERLKIGDIHLPNLQSPAVLIHCKQGRRRSPTAVLAFLVSQGMRAHKALQVLGAGYEGESDWVAGYKQHRAQWISCLTSFESKYKLQLDHFRKTQPKLIKAYQGQIFESDDHSLSTPSNTIFLSETPLPTSPTPNSKKRRTPDVDTNPTNPTPAKKYKIATNSPLTPSLWANRGKK